MNLSDKAIQDLRKTIEETYGKDFAITLSDIDLQEIGIALLTILAENLKMRALNS